LDEITSGAISGLSAVVAELLPPAPVAGLPHTIRVVPVRVAPTGLGGFVSLNRSPAGEILGRRLDARVVVTVRVTDSADLQPAVDEVATAVVARDFGAARGAGLLRIGFEEFGPRASSGQGAGEVHRMDVEFLALFEHLRLPADGEDTIERVPLLFEVGSTAAAGEALYRTRFRVGALDAFDVFDDPAATQDAPSQWEFDEAGSRIRQRSEIRGGSDGVDPDKPGTYLVLRPEIQQSAVADLVVGTEFRSDGRDGIGLVFRWLDVDNFYFLLLDERRGYRMLGRKVGGVFAALDEPALDLSGSYIPEQVHSVRVSVQADRIRVHLDGELVLAGRDGALTAPGAAGLVCWGNGAASFFGIDVVAL